MTRIKSRTATVVTGIELSLNQDDATHLSYALGEAIRLADKHRFSSGGSKWPWLETFKDELDKARGRGTIMGSRII